MATKVEKETFGTAKMAKEEPHSLLGIMKRETTALWGRGLFKG
jgi:hypothetical protein